MKVLVIGCGLQGFEIARDLARDVEVGVCDIDRSRLERLRKTGISSFLYQVDIRDKKKIAKLIRRYDVVIGAVPGRFGFNLVKTVIEAGRDMVDISFMPENILSLNQLAKKHKVKVIADCGLAPGLSNMLVGHAIGQLNKVKEIHIAVGGLPQSPKPPLNYRTVFSLADVLEEYTRKVRVVSNGRIKEIEPLTGLKKITFKGVGLPAEVPQGGTQAGEFECFYTDGLRTLAYTIKGIKEMTEKTIRYPGHTREIKTLIECGFLDTKPLQFKNMKISPREFILAVLSPKLRLGKDKDITLFRVDIIGKKHACSEPFGKPQDKRSESIRYEMVDYYKDGVTSMARTTGYPCAIMARLIKGIGKAGIIPPEELGKDERLFSQLMDGLKIRGIRIKEDIIQ